MAKLIYLTNASLDGYIEDEHGAFDLYEPDDDVFAATTALLRSFGTFLYGRRLYETMSVWETDPALAEQSDFTAEFASVWQAADKVVYSTTLTAVTTATTRLERDFEPDAVRKLKAAASSDLTIGGANLAAQAMAAGLVDECRLARDRRRRQTGPARGHPHQPRAARRTPIRQRRPAPSLPHPNMTGPRTHRRAVRSCLECKPRPVGRMARTQLADARDAARRAPCLENHHVHIRARATRERR
jgi:dihydrofolate reductase